MLTENDRNALIARLMKIVSKETVIVCTRNGPVEDQGAADKNAIAAAKLLVAIQTQVMKYEQQQARLGGSGGSTDTAELGAANSFGGHGPEEPRRAGDASAQRSRKQWNSRPLAAQGQLEMGGEAETDGGKGNGNSFAHDEADQTSSDIQHTAEQMVREAVRQARLELEELSDHVDNEAVIERARAKLCPVGV